MSFSPPGSEQSLGQSSHKPPSTDSRSRREYVTTDSNSEENKGLGLTSNARTLPRSDAFFRSNTGFNSAMATAPLKRSANHLGESMKRVKSMVDQYSPKKPKYNTINISRNAPLNTSGLELSSNRHPSPPLALLPFPNTSEEISRPRSQLSAIDYGVSRMSKSASAEPISTKDDVMTRLASPTSPGPFSVEEKSIARFTTPTSKRSLAQLASEISPSSRNNQQVKQPSDVTTQELIARMMAYSRTLKNREGVTNDMSSGDPNTFDTHHSDEQLRNSMRPISAQRTSQSLEVDSTQKSSSSRQLEPSPNIADISGDSSVNKIPPGISFPSNIGAHTDLSGYRGSHVGKTSHVRPVNMIPRRLKIDMDQTKSVRKGTGSSAQITSLSEQPPLHSKNSDIPSKKKFEALASKPLSESMPLSNNAVNSTLNTVNSQAIQPSVSPETRSDTSSEKQTPISAPQSKPKFSFAKFSVSTASGSNQMAGTETISGCKTFTAPLRTTEPTTDEQLPLSMRKSSTGVVTSGAAWTELQWRSFTIAMRNSLSKESISSPSALRFLSEFKSQLPNDMKNISLDEVIRRLRVWVSRTDRRRQG